MVSELVVAARVLLFSVHDAEGESQSPLDPLETLTSYVVNTTLPIF